MLHEVRLVLTRVDGYLIERALDEARVTAVHAKILSSVQLPDRVQRRYQGCC